MKFLGISFGRRKPQPLQELPPGPVGELQRTLTNQALDIAFTLGESLDFSHASIDSVEKVLGLVSDRYKKTNDSTGLNGVAFQFGSYIASTIQRTLGKGLLLRDHAELGQNSFPFQLDDSAIFPFAWCQKRIFDGQADNVATKYRYFVLDKHDGMA